MGEMHDALANEVGNFILSKIRANDTTWRQVFSSNINRIGCWEWPRPDVVLKDNTLSATYANEFKPPFQNKREYLTGLGQSLSYLQSHNYAGLIIPKYSDDNFRISEYIKDTLISNEFKHLPISLVEYDISNLRINPEQSIRLLKGIDTTRSSALSHRANTNETFWAFWRDASPNEIFDILRLSDKYSYEKGDIYTKYIYPEFYKMMISGQTKQWDGSPRDKNASEASEKAEKQNYKIPLFQLGLIDQAEGRLTKKGYQLLFVGKMYGSESAEYLDFLTYILLTDGKHLELINEVLHFQRSVKVPESSAEYSLNIEKYLSDCGFIGPRKPTAIKTGAKNSYLRDEQKLWNKLGLLVKKSKVNYIFPKEGYKFNWSNITRILLKNYDLI